MELVRAFFCNRRSREAVRIIWRFRERYWVFFCFFLFFSGGGSE